MRERVKPRYFADRRRAFTSEPVKEFVTADSTAWTADNTILLASEGTSA